MSTSEQTRVVSARVGLDVAEALEADAAELKLAEGTLVRRILEARYGGGVRARKTNRSARNAPDDDLMEVV